MDGSHGRHGLAALDCLGFMLWCGHILCIANLLRRHPGLNRRAREAQEPVQLAHPFCITCCEVIVDLQVARHRDRMCGVRSEDGISQAVRRGKGSEAEDHWI